MSSLQVRLQDDGWTEVGLINSYALFLGYVSMAIKGLGFLVLTWTTVVLLGGFVSILQKKDFWCLTFITLVQMAGDDPRKGGLQTWPPLFGSRCYLVWIFDVALNEKLRYIMHATTGLLVGIFLGVMGENVDSVQQMLLRPLLAFTLLFVQIMVIVTVLGPLALIYVLGILMSAGVSLWRLIEHDYTGKSEGEESNLVPALDTLYCLALLQGVLFCFKFIMRLIGKRMVKKVATKCDDSELELVSNYLRETRSGCEKDPSFVKRRSLITHAVDMIGSHSPADCDSGVKILYTALSIVERELKQLVEDGKNSSDDYLEKCFHFLEQQKLLKYLVLSTSSSRDILQKLLKTMDSRGTHDRETRNKAAMIVARIAVDINLEQFPRGIEYISSLIGTFQQYSIGEPFLRERLPEMSERIFELTALRKPHSPELEKAYKELLLQGLGILQKLATNGNNCRVISNTQDLVSKIMAPVTFDLLDHTTDDHGAWSDVVEGSIKVMIQLTSAPGETGTKLRREISSCKEAINTLQRILRCTKCNEGLQQRAIEILTRLYMDTESSRCGAEFVVVSSCSREEFVRMLLDIFTHHNKYIDIRKSAGVALSMLCRHGGISDAITIIQTGGGDVIDSLTTVLLRKKYVTYWQAAAAILEHLCTQYTEHDACCGKLQKAMADAMPEVIGEILRFGDQKHNERQADQDGFAKTKTDIENQCDNIPGREIISPSSSHPQNDEQDVEKVFAAARLVSSLLSLCGTVYDTFISELAPDLAHQFHESSFIDKLKEMVVKKGDHPRVENVLLLKAIGKMVVSMLKHNDGKFIRQEDLKSLIEALSGASKNMLELDYSIVFGFDNSCSTIQLNTMSVTPPKLNSCTLRSVVKEAEELHAMMPSTSVSG